MTSFLNWPNESATIATTKTNWHQAGSNICLDFHGDPVAAKLVIFSDGNHHMALQEAVQEFLQHHPELLDIFYATVPPGVLMQYMQQAGLSLGNLNLTRMPDVFIGTKTIMENLHSNQLVSQYSVFAKSLGNVLLVRKGNPKNIQNIEDLLREDINLFMSNPETEKASYQVYYDSLLALCTEKGIDASSLHTNNLVYGEKIHHREAPQAIYSGNADVAIVYYHLALRYCRIFPEEFDFIPLGGNKEHPRPSDANKRTLYYVGLLSNADNSSAGNQFIEYLLSDEGAAIYEAHGLKAIT